MSGTSQFNINLTLGDTKQENGGKSEEATKKKKKKINTSVFPELPVITTEHEYGSLGLGKEHLKPRPSGKECLKPRLLSLDNSRSPCYNVTVDKLRVAFHGDKYSLAGEN